MTHETEKGSPQFLGLIVATTTKNNHDTATPFNNTGEALKGMMLLLQPDAVCHIRAGTTNAVTVTTANGVKLIADEKYVITMTRDEGWLAAVGTANVKVFQLK